MKTALATPDPEDLRPAIANPPPVPEPSDATNSRPAMPASAPDEPPPGGPDSPATIGGAATVKHSSRGSNVPGPVAEDMTTPRLASLLDPALFIAASMVDDVEKVRKANENRLRQLTRDVADSDGEERGLGLPLDDPAVLRAAGVLGALHCKSQLLKDLKLSPPPRTDRSRPCCVECEAVKNLERHMKQHPLASFAENNLGVGYKQLARLLAAISDPYINSAKGEPRTVSALWAYCGLHVLPGDHHSVDAQGHRVAGDQHRDTDQSLHEDHPSCVGVAAKRRKGERANWSSAAKSYAWNIVVSCLKVARDADCRDGHTSGEDQCASAVPAQAPQDQGGQVTSDAHITVTALSCGCSPYRVVYDRRRAHTAMTRPEWTDGHSHNDALRVASKEILKDLWRAARDWHHRQERTS